jgi:hypothetical protein
MTPKQVVKVATAAMAGHGSTLSKFRAKAPKYSLEKHQWSVFFMQTGYYKMVDGEMLVLIDDNSGKACVQQAMAVGPCT